MSKLDEFICWLTEALETTENWTPPKAEAESLKLYLETHLVSLSRLHQTRVAGRRTPNQHSAEIH